MSGWFADRQLSNFAREMWTLVLREQVEAPANPAGSKQLHLIWFKPNTALAVTRHMKPAIDR